MANKTIIKAFSDKGGVAVGATDLTVSSSLKLPDGTAATPGLHFKDDTNTGLFRNTTDKLTLATAGASALTIDATQQVGIGTENPLDLLQVGSGTTATQGVPFTGININAPAGELPTLSLLSDSTADDAFIFFGVPGAGNANRGSIIYDHGLDRLGFGTADTQNRVVLDSSGNVGIGTGSPAEKLHLFAGASGSSRLRLDGGNAGTDQWVIEANFPNGRLDFQNVTNGSVLAMLFNGNVGIGTTSPTATLDVNGTTRYRSTTVNITATNFLLIPTATYIKVNPDAGGYQFGFDHPSIEEGDFFIIENISGFAITLAGGFTGNAANVKFNGGASSYTMNPGAVATMIASAGATVVEISTSDN